MCGFLWRVLIVLIVLARDVWKNQPSLDRGNQQSFLWMRALTGLEERASYVHFWLELLLRGWWSLGQRLQWAGNHYTKPSVLTGAFRLQQSLTAFPAFHPLILRKGRELEITEQRILRRYQCFCLFFHQSIFMNLLEIKKSILDHN